MEPVPAGRTLDRRTLLRIGGMAALSAGAGLPPARAGSSAPAGPSARTGPRPSDWNALRRGLEGRLIRPGDAAYDAARRLFDPAHDAVRPAGVAYCANPSDVAECVTFARRLGCRWPYGPAGTPTRAGPPAPAWSSTSPRCGR
nr:hypothetical protein GCM10020093_093840 [Planobispora longispora]